MCEANDGSNPPTRRHHATQDEFIDALNNDLSSEYQSIVQHNQHIATITGPEYASTLTELTLHLSQELEHARVLASQVSFPGGTPTTVVPEVADPSSSEGALKAGLMLEERQLYHYRKRSSEANDLGLIDVGEALRPILEQTH